MSNLNFDPSELAAPGVLGLSPYQPGKPIDELEREYGVSDIIKLASNENPNGPSSRVRTAIADSIVDITRYPDGGGVTLKQKLSSHLKVNTDQITLGNGSNEVLDLVVRVFVSPGQEVIYAQHAFAVYALATQAASAKHKVVAAKEWRHDLAAMAEAVSDDTRVIFVANPNNPTGTWSRKDELRSFLENVPSHVIVVVDEAYAEYVAVADYPNCIDWLADFPNLVVTRTFSKIYGLAALRVGYSVSSPKIADYLNRVRQPFNVNTLGQIAAIAALDDGNYIDQCRLLNNRELDRLQAELQGMGLVFIPSVGNFISVDMGRPAMEIFESLLRSGVIVRPVANYGMPNHLRITVGLPEENDRFLASLRGCL